MKLLNADPIFNRFSETEIYTEYICDLDYK